MWSTKGVQGLLIIFKNPENDQVRVKPSEENQRVTSSRAKESLMELEGIDGLRDVLGHCKRLIQLQQLVINHNKEVVLQEFQQ